MSTRRRGSKLSCLPRGNRVKGLALVLWRDQRHEMLAVIGSLRNNLSHLLARLQQQNREIAELKRRIGAMEHGGPDPALLANLHGLTQRCENQRREIENLRRALDRQFVVPGRGDS